MKNVFKNYFHYTHSERNGLLLLSGLILFFVLLPQFYSIFHSNGTSNFDTFEQELAVFKSNLNKAESSNHTKSAPVFPSTSVQPLNPNTASKENLLQLGISEKVVKTILNYRNKGGRFYQKEDLKKIYGLKESDYLRIKDFIIIPRQIKKYPEQTKSITPPRKKQVLEFFNPNLADQEMFEQLGFPEKTIKIIFNYRNKGGSFYKKEDLLKIYGMDSTLYEQLHPFILLDKRNNSLPKDSFKIKTPKEPFFLPKEIQPPIIVDINKANLEDWKKIKGIGDYYGKKILAFREKLGGFSSIDQIQDTYGLRDSVFQVIKPQLVFSPIYTKIKLNQVDAKTLKLHPYINKKQATIIINFRNNHGSFTSAEDLHQVKILTPEDIMKISPYLSFEE